MEKNNKKRKLFLIIIAAILLLIAFLLGLSKCTGLADNAMTVYETQDNSLFVPTYDENESSVFAFLPAKDAQGEVTYELISAKDSDFKEADYFTLLSKTDTQILVAKGTPAGVYTLQIRAHATGDSNHKEADKDITYIYTIDKAASEYTAIPSAIEGLIYNGKDQILIHEGSSPYGKILYKVNDGEWSEELPTGLDAGIYTVFYKLVGDNNHEDISEQSFLVSIGKKTTSYKPGSYSTASTSSSSISGLFNYIKDKTDNASDGKETVSGKPGTYVEYVYDGNEHNNGYRTPTGVTMVGENHGINAGTYVAIYTPDKNHCWSDGTRTPVQVKMVIKRKEFDKPTVNDVLIYNGEVQYADIVGFDEEAMLITGNCGKDAGTYKAIVSLKDKLNYKWTDNTIDNVKLDWHIFPMAVNVPKVTTTFVFKGGMKKVGIIVTEYKKSQTVEVEDFNTFNSDLIKIIRGNTHTDAGNYEIEIALKDKHNYKWNDEEGGSGNRLVPWTIERKPIGDKPVNKTVVYNGYYQSNGYKKPDEVTVTGDYRGKDAGEYTATYTLYNNYCWSDKTYAPVTVTLTITNAGIEKPTNTSVTRTYNGCLQTNGYDKPDGIDLIPGGSDRGTDVGTYTAVYVPDENHTWSDGSREPVTVILTIEKAKLDVPTIVGDSSFVYDGKNHRIEIAGFDSNVMNMSGDFGNKKYVGDYSVTISLKNWAKKNYEWNTNIPDDTSDKILNWSITTSGLTVPSVNKEFVYNGKWQQVKLSDLDNYDRKLMKIVSMKNGLDAGDYEIVIGLEDKNNYVWEDGTTEDKTITWTIKQAENTINVIESQVIVTTFSPEDHRVFFAGATNAKGEVSYTLTSATKQGSKESAIDNFVLDGTYITIKGNTPDGLYYLTVKVNAEGDKNYKPASKDINIVLTNNGIHYIVQFDGNGADNGTMEKQNYYGSILKQPLRRNEFVREGYEFAGWNTQSDGSGKDFKDHEFLDCGDFKDYQNEGYVNLYAQWELEEYTIFYNNATVSDESAKSFTIESSPFNLSKPDEKHGYNFAGWNTAEDGSGKTFKTNEKVSYGDLKPYIENGTVNLYAQWEGKRYLILLIDSRSDGLLPFSTDYATYGEPYGDVLYDLSLEGYDSGWYTLPEGTSIEITSESIVDDSVFSMAASVLEDYIESNLGSFAASLVDGLLDGVDFIPLFARYTPYINTPYTVNHYLQKLNSDNYEESAFKTETRFGTTDEEIKYEEQQIKVTGFHFAKGTSEPRSNNPTVLADGSRIINIYYDREIYTVSFNSKGGKDVESQKIPYQGLVTEPDLYERTDAAGNAYTLAGWYSNGKQFDFSNDRVKGNIVLVAEWEKSVYVEAVSNNSKFGTVEGSGGYRNGENVTLKAYPKENYRFVRWEDADGEEVSTNSEYSFTVTQEMIDAKDRNIRFVAVFEQINSRSLALYEEKTFYADPGDEISITDLYLSDRVSSYSALTEEGNPLSLEIDGTVYKGAHIKVAENAQPGTYVINVTATPKLFDLIHKPSTIKITVVVKDKTPVVTFNSNGGTDVKEQKVNDDGHVTKPADPYREGYVFMGWYLGEEAVPFDFDNTTIGTDITLVAKWGYRVRFDINGGTSGPIGDQIVEVGGFATKPEDPVYDDSHHFTLWKLDGETFNFTTPITRNITLVAEWTEEETRTIKVSVNNRDAGIPSGAGTYGINDNVELFAKAYRGYIFVGWDYTGDGQVDCTDNPWTFPAADSYPEYVAIFKKMDELTIFRYQYREYNVDTNGNSVQINVADNMIAGDATLLDISKIEAEYDFEDNHIVFETHKTKETYWIFTIEYYDRATIKIAGDTPLGVYKLHITAKDKIFGARETITIVINVVDSINTVTFDSNGGSQIPDQEIGDGGYAMRPVDPIYEGYVFDNWYLGEETEPFSFVGRPINSNITLTARWLEAETVAFNSNGGSDVPSQTIGKGRYAAKPADPYLEGYQFVGWYLGEETVPFDFKNRTIEGDIELHAEWIKANLVTFNSGEGGSDVPSQTVISGNCVTRPADPTNTNGKLFDGWYLNGELFDFTTEISGDIELVAHWAETHTISLYPDGYDSETMPDMIIKVKHGEYAKKPADPVCTGYDFNGWFVVIHDSDVEWPEFIFETTPIEENYELVADWSMKQNYTVYYELEGVKIEPRKGVYWIDGGLAPADNPTHIGRRFSGWYIDAEHTKPYTNQTYAELAHYDDSIMYVTLYGSWFDISIIDYKAYMASYEGDVGEDATFAIKDEDRWFLVFDEYEIVGGNEDNVIRLTADKNHLVISDKAEPGKYYVEVRAKWSSILKYFGVDYDLSSLDVIPEDVQELLDKYSQTLLVEWTVLEREDEVFGSFNYEGDGGMITDPNNSYYEGDDQGVFMTPGYHQDIIESNDPQDNENYENDDSFQGEGPSDGTFSQNDGSTNE
ncbi:MAG: InlB B-repeat-containing protein [Erysipelotrichaceae bacterium]|nr:InlB B-repeat-containing protein [Erysipelotrichaceae bacterium]